MELGRICFFNGMSWERGYVVRYFCKNERSCGIFPHPALHHPREWATRPSYDGMAQAFTGVLASNGGGISHPRPIGKYIYIHILVFHPL